MFGIYIQSVTRSVGDANLGMNLRLEKYELKGECTMSAIFNFHSFKQSKI